MAEPEVYPLYGVANGGHINVRLAESYAHGNAASFISPSFFLLNTFDGEI